MQNRDSRFAELIAGLAPKEGPQPTAIPGVCCVRYSQQDDYAKRRWRACLALCAQGRKEIQLGPDDYWAAAGHYTATPVDLPVISRVAEASPERPYLGILIELDPRTLSELALQIEWPPAVSPAMRAMFTGRADEKMLDAAIRMLELLYIPEDAPVLGPLLVKEILYRLLKGPNGQGIRQFVRSGSKLHLISQAVFRLKSELSEDIDVTALAQAANMSRSAFFKSFHEVTSLSPIQYQKRLRLHEARRLMIEDGETAESAAFRVGYRSPSQFSREYSRMFGDAPIRDATRRKDSGIDESLLSLQI